MRCAIVPQTPVPYREPLFRALHERDDLDICVIYQSAGQPSWDVPPEWFVARHAYPAQHLPSWQRGRPGRSPIVWPRGLERALRSADPDCVVAMEFGPASLRAWQWCRRHGRAYVIFSDCTPQINPMLSPGQVRLHRWLARQADGLIAVSSAGRERLLAFGVPPDRITVALQSGDLEPVRAATSGLAWNGARPLTVLSVGRLVPDKNFATLIEAFAQASVPPEGTRLEIAGIGFAQTELRALADRLDVPVVFHGAVPPSEMPGLYAAADVFALVSTYEPFGIAIREAVAAGLPIICSRTAGTAGDVAVAGRNALLVDPAHTDAVAAAMSRLLTDQAMRERMGAASRAIDKAVDGSDVEAFTSAVRAAAARRRSLPAAAPPTD